MKKLNWFRVCVSVVVLMILFTDVYSMALLRRPEAPQRPEIFINDQPIDSFFVLIQELVYSRPDSMRLLVRNALEKVREAGHIEWQAKMQGLLGISFALESEYLRAREYFHKALELAIQSGDHNSIGDAYNNLGGIDFITGNRKDALENFHEAIRNYNEGGYFSKAANIHTNIGSLYVELNNFDKAFYHLHKAYQNLLQFKNTTGQTIALNSLAHAYRDIGQTDSALYFINKSIALSEETRNHYSLANALELKASIYLKTNRYKDAFDFYVKSLETAQVIKNTSMISNSYLGLARLSFELKEIDESLSYAYQSLELASRANDLKVKSDVRILLSSLYEHIGDYETSLHHYKAAEEIKTQISNQSKLHQIYNIEISRLSKEKEVQQLEIEQQKLLVSKRNSAIIIISLIFSIITITLILIFSKIRQNQKIRMNKALLKHSEESAKAALNAEIQERKRLGIELHDGIGPLLSLAKLNVTALLEKPGLNESRKSVILQNTVGTLNEILREIKYISHNMAPIVLIEKGFESAVKDLVIKLNETEKYTVQLDITGLNGKLEHYCEYVLYRSMLEILHNTLLHANGSDINIQIIQNEEDITIMIEDNGRGFKVEEKLNGNGLGLKSAISRIEGIKGKLYIDSEDGRGTIVTMIVPLG